MIYSNGVLRRVLKERVWKGVDMSKRNDGEAQQGRPRWEQQELAASTLQTWRESCRKGQLPRSPWQRRQPWPTLHPAERETASLSRLLPVPPSASQCLPVPEPSRKPESKEGQGGKIRKANGDHPGPCSNLEQRKATEFLGPCLVLGHFTSY